MAFSPDGKTLVSTGSDAIRLWSGSQFLAYDTNSIRGVFAGRCGFWQYDSVVGYGGGISIHLHTGLSIPWHIPRMDRRTSGSSDETIRLEGRTHECGQYKRKFEEYTSTYWYMTFSPDGRTLASAGRDTIWLWNVVPEKPSVA